MVPLAKPPVRKLARDLGVDLHTLTGSGDGGVITRDDVRAAAPSASPAAAAPTGTRREPIRGVRRVFTVARYETPGADTVVEVDSPLGPVSLVEPPRYTDPAAEVAAGSLLAPMPGSVIRVAVSVGDTVTAGQALIVLEAMKMEHTVSAPADGVLAELNVSEKDQVDTGQVLAVVS